MNIKKIFPLILLLIISNIYLPNEVEISRQYLINQNIAKSLPLKDSFLLEGILSFQACDTSACIPIVQDLNHTIINDSNEYTSDVRFGIDTFSLEENNNNSMLPDWGNFSVNTFIKVLITKPYFFCETCFRIHIFSTTTCSCPYV